MKDDMPMDTFSFVWRSYGNDKNWYSLDRWFDENHMKELIVRNNVFPKILEFINKLKSDNQNMWKDVDIAKKLEDIISEEKIKASRMSVPK